MKSLKKSRIILALYTFLLLLCQCGLEDVPALDPPYADTYSNIDDTFSLRVTSDNDEPELRGFEIYYKFYENSPEGTSAEDYTSKSQLDYAGFRRLTAETESPSNIVRPLIEIPGPAKGEKSLVTVYFREISTAGSNYLEEVYIDAVRDLPGTGIEFTDLQTTRNYFVTGFDYKGFNSNNSPSDFDEDDTDLTGLNLTAGNDKTLYVVLYSFAYGLDELVKVYSDAVYLGFIDIQIKVAP